MAPCLSYLTIQDEYTTEELGHAFEALVGTQLVRTNESLFYWREGNYEIDFILTKGRKVWAIEVKSAKKKAKSMVKYLEKYPESTPVFISKENYFDFENDPIQFLSRQS